MEQIELPFWLVTERKHILNPPQAIPCEDPKAPHAFTSAERLTAFLNARGGGRWEVNLVADNEGLLIAIADVHQRGVTNVCFDPEPDGSGGHLKRITDILQVYNRADKSA